MNTKDIATAIGVCSAAADMAYDVNQSVQTKQWSELRSAVYNLSELMEKIAKQEVTQ